MQIDSYGAGKPVLLVHGSPGAAQSWRPVGDRLADRFRILAPTLPGHDGNAADETPVERHLGVLTAALAAALPALDGPLPVAGHSFGGAVALRLALTGTVPIERLVLFEPVAFGALILRGGGDMYDASRDYFDAYVREVHSGDTAAIARMIDFWTRPGAYDAMPAGMQAVLQTRALVNARDIAAVFCERYTAADLARLDVPVLLINGTRSPPVAAAIIEALMALLPRAETAVIDGADHMMTATHPDAVAALLADFASA